jgi:hypothetical protein
VIFAIVGDPARHSEFDGSGMLRGLTGDASVSSLGDVFTMSMHRLGRDYTMINYVVEFERDRRFAWEPAPGDIGTAGGDPEKIGVPSGYRWGFELVDEGDSTTLVTEFFDCGSDDNRWILEREGGSWINGSDTVVELLATTLERLDVICRNEQQ